MFDNHKLNKNGFKEINTFKEDFSIAVINALNLMPEGREKAIFKTKIEEAVFFGDKAIASKKSNFDEVIIYGEGKLNGKANNN